VEKFLTRAAFYVVVHLDDSSSSENELLSMDPRVLAHQPPEVRLAHANLLKAKRAADAAAARGEGAHPDSLVAFARAVVRAGRGGTDPDVAAAAVMAAQAQRKQQQQPAKGAKSQGGLHGEDEDDESDNEPEGAIGKEAREQARQDEIAEARYHAEARGAAVQRLLSNRMQAASLFAAPFSMRFAAGEVQEVKDLLRCTLSEWGLRGAAEGDALFDARAAKQLDENEGEDLDIGDASAVASSSIAPATTGVGEFRFQIEAMLRTMVGNDQAKASSVGRNAIFANDDVIASASNAKAAKADAFAKQSSTNNQLSNKSSRSRGGFVAGYGRADPMDKHANPFLNEADTALVRRGNANGFKGVDPTAASSMTLALATNTRSTRAGVGRNQQQQHHQEQPDALPAGPIPQKKLPFDPRFQRGPWDPSGKQPRARYLMPQLHPPAVLKVSVVQRFI
jgi:hypothetical protein